MSQLAIIATLEVKAGTRERVLDVMLRHRARCLEEEPGTLAFEVLVPEDDTKLMLYELYSDDASFDAHWNGASIKLAREEGRGDVLGILAVRCLVGAQPSGQGGTPQETQ